EGRRMNIHRRDAMTRIDVRARMQEPARVDERLRILFVSRRLLVGVMHDRRETAVARCAEHHALHGVRAIADAVIHLASRQHQLDRPPRYASAECGERYMRPGAKSRAERATDER